MIALWYINETPEQLQQLLIIDEFIPFKNDRRNTHWLSARIALQEAIGKQTSRIIKNKEGKPFLEAEDGHISMSHSGEMSAAIFNTTHSCGIDLELFDKRIERITYKFTTDEEVKCSRRISSVLVHACFGAQKKLYSNSAPFTK